MRNLWKLLTKNKLWFSIIGFFLLVLTEASLYLLYTINLLSGIENFLRICGAVVIVIVWLLFILIGIKIILKNKKVRSFIYIFLLLIYIIGSFVVSININQIYSKVENISSNYTVHSTSIVTLKDNEADSLKDIGNKKIGIISDENNIEGYQIPKDILKKNNMTNELDLYDNFITMIHSLYEEDIEYIFLPTNYVVMFKNIDGLENIGKETKIIYTEEQKIKKKNISKNSTVDKPFTVLLMGVDSEKENIKDSSFNGDALILLTFNPSTLNTTILSIPRDTYVPIACFSGQRQNKITHAAWYGEECMIATIENFTGIDINYYLKINFKGVVKLVDSLGGIEVDVPMSFCEQDSNRNFSNLICLDKGEQTINGEEALALSRHRKTINDFVRGQNQQLIVRSVMNKAKDIRSIDTIYKLLDTISNNMETNMSTTEILSFYNIGKDILLKSKDTAVDELLGMQRLYISGYDKYIYDYNAITNQGTRLNLYNFVPYKGSLDAVIKAMKINLGIEEKEMVKHFSFSINDPYEESVVGKGYYNESQIPLVPNFIGQYKENAINFGTKYGININISYVSTSDSNYKVGQIIEQSVPTDTDIKYVNTINIKVVDEVTYLPGNPSDIPNCSIEENKDHTSCKLPNFVGKDYSVFTNWNNSYKYSIQINIVEVNDGDDDYDASKAGQIIYQSKTSGTSIFDLIGNNLEIKYIAYKSQDNNPEIPGTIEGQLENENNQ
jgi:LCP family protein required for cell wall assembly